MVNLCSKNMFLIMEPSALSPTASTALFPSSRLHGAGGQTAQEEAGPLAELPGTIPPAPWGHPSSRGPRRTTKHFEFSSASQEHGLRAKATWGVFLEKQLLGRWFAHLQGLRDRGRVAASHSTVLHLPRLLFCTPRCSGDPPSSPAGKKMRSLLLQGDGEGTVYQLCNSEPDSPFCLAS